MEKSYEKIIRLTDDAFVVNGDDVLFTIPPAGYQSWVTNVTSAGLAPSIGKNYVSRRHAVINSQIFDCGSSWDWTERSIEVQKVPILYLNLLRGGEDQSVARRKDISLLVGDSLSRGGDLQSRMEELIAGWDSDHREKFLERSYFYNRDLLKKLPPVSWYLPKCLGGLELPKPAKATVSTFHLRIASMILCLDDKSRREMVRLQWLKHPGNAFCEITNKEINRVHDELGNEFVLSTSKNDERMFSRLIRSNLGYGVEEGLFEPELILKNWNRTYLNWGKKVNKIKWTESHDHNVKGLHAMNVDKALSYKGLHWTRESNVKWV
jgi:hypothetical protein